MINAKDSPSIDISIITRILLAAEDTSQAGFASITLSASEPVAQKSVDELDFERLYPPSVCCDDS